MRGYRGISLMIKRLLPVRIKLFGRRVIKFFKYRYRRVKISGAVARDKQMKVILGAAETHQGGWYSTNEQWLDITSPADWARIFKGKKLITHVVAEHVFEHLSHEECETALKNISAHMVDGGHIRIAVPDGYNPNEEYLRHVGINGIGDDAETHKQLLNVDVLIKLFISAGFEPEHIEGYDASNRLIQEPYSADDGFIRRSRSSNAQNVWGVPDAVTSLIVDGSKK